MMRLASSSVMKVRLVTLSKSSPPLRRSMTNEKRAASSNVSWHLTMPGWSISRMRRASTCSRAGGEGGGEKEAKRVSAEGNV